MDIFGNDLLVALGSAFPFLVTGYVGIYNNPMLPLIGSAFHRLDSDTTTGHGSVYGNAALVTLDTAFSNLVTMTGHCTVDDNPAVGQQQSAGHARHGIQQPGHGHWLLDYEHLRQ